MSVWSHLQSRHPITGAFRTLSSDFLGEVSLAPKTPDLDWDAALAQPGMPWATSLAVMPRQVHPTIERGFYDLVRATTDARLENIDVERLPDGRARQHLQGLLHLGASLGELPSDLAVARYVLEHGTCLEHLPMCPAPFGFDCVLEEALHRRLSSDHGTAEGPPPIAEQAALGSLLNHVQANLLQSTSPVPRDDSIRAFGVRDAAAEADLTAALVRQYLDAGAAPSQVAVMSPDFQQGTELLRVAFESAGIPLSGLPDAPVRDAEGELLWLVVQVLRSAPPPMTVAALCLSSAMPWNAGEGRDFARRVMEYGSFRDLPEWLKQMIGVAPKSFRALLGIVSKLSTDISALSPLTARLAALTPPDAETPICWDTLLAALQPSAATAEIGVRFSDSVCLWTGEAEPLRPVRHLVVTGFAGNAYPRRAGTNPLFLDSELRLIEDQIGLRMPTRGEILRRNLNRFHRQICAVSDTLDLLVPRRELNGDRLQPAPGLALIARCVEGSGKPEDFVCELTPHATSEWPCAIRSIRQCAHTAPVLPEGGVVRTEHDLLRLRKDDLGHMKPQSPSRLENMLTSPLVWMMREAGAQPREWLPRGLDVMTQGSLFHTALEMLFPKDRPVLDASALADGFPAAFEKAVVREAPFLNDPLWAVERASLWTEAFRMATEWRNRIEGLGAKVIGTEQPLAGTALGIRLSGIADEVLELSGGARMVIDFKASSSGKRRTRMEKGWDLQVALYRAMLTHPDNEETAALTTGGEVGIAYHLLRDGVTLASGAGSDGTGIEAVPGDISREALAQLETTIAELGGGTLRLNRASDIAWFEKEASVPPYGLKEDELAQALTLPDADAEEVARV